MSYPITANGFTHMIPNTSSVLGAETLTATAAVHGEYIATRRCAVKRIGFIVTTGVSTTDPAKVEFNVRPTPGSATGETLAGELVIPNGIAAGKVIYKDIEPVIVEVGQALSLEHTALAASAGAGLYTFEVEDAPEVPGNEDNMILSE